MRKINRIKFVASVAIIALFGIVPLAQAGTTGNGAAQRIQAAVNTCLAMPHDKMVADQGCKSLMAQHPEMFSGK
jgi:hypothetical protein